MNAFAPQPLPGWKRAVLKVGSSLLAGESGLEATHARGLAGFIAAARAQGREVVLVSSGAVAAGRGRIGATGNGLVQRQALAALGQASLMGFWQALFEAPVAQVLLTHDDLRNRRRYLNARTALQELLRLGAQPIVNENDTVAVDELKLGDNDNLAAAVASLVQADLLLIATDIAGLYTGNPARDPAARPVPRIETVSAEVLAMAGEAGALGTGGMRTKLKPRPRPPPPACPPRFLRPRPAGGAGAGQACCTAACRRAGQPPARARKQWLRHAPASGALLVDEARAGRCCAVRRCCRAGYARCRAISAAATCSTCAAKPATCLRAGRPSTTRRTPAASPAATAARSRRCWASATTRRWCIATIW